MASKKKKKEAPKKETPKFRSVADMVAGLEKTKEIKHVELQQRTAADYMSIGSLAVDLITGGGFFGGRVLQIFGPAHSFKSTLGYTAAGLLGKKKVFTQFYDFEGTTERKYAMSLGMDFDNNPLLRYYKPNHGPEAYDMMINIAKQLPDQEGGQPQLCWVIDTVATMPTKIEMDDWEEATRMAMRAAMHSEWMGRLRTLISKKNIAVIAINQIRANPSPYAPPVARPGGNAWEFATDTMVSARGKGKPVEVGADIYQQVIFKTLKNKNFMSQQECAVYCRLGKGIDPAFDAIEFLRLTGLYRKEPKKPPVIEGLDAWSGGEKLDGSYQSAKLEKLIRGETDAGEPRFVNACKAFLASGEALKAFLAQKTLKQAKIDAKEAKKAAKDGDANSAIGDSEEASEEAANEAAMKRLKKKRKSAPAAEPEAEAPAAE